MLKFTSLALSVSGKKGFKFLSVPKITAQQIRLGFWFTSIKTRNQFQAKLASGKYYEVLGFPPGVEPNSLSNEQIKSQYLTLMKKYHSDSVLDPEEKLHNDEISKCIISAFSQLIDYRKKNKIGKDFYKNVFQVEDELAMKIYGVKFDKAKYQIYGDGDPVKKALFKKELRERKGYNQQQRQSQQKMSNGSQAYSSRTSEDSGSMRIAIILGVLLLGGTAFYFNTKSSSKYSQPLPPTDKKSLTFSKKQLRQIEKKSNEMQDKKINDLINSFVEQQPPCLEYPTKEDPPLMDQLLEYTIATDAKFYEVPGCYLSNQNKLDLLKQIKDPQQLNELEDFKTFPITKAKTNSFVTLSLEAQRCLQNIYIPVKDVIEQIEKTGKYTPPKVLFRFYGYVMFELRQKPMSLLNYRNTEYISLFDLFFDYYSPIPIKRHQYNEYLVGLKEENESLYGQVHLNHRKIPQRFITKDDKLVVMRDKVNDKDQKYKQIWDNFYEKYSTVWRREERTRTL